MAQSRRLFSGRGGRPGGVLARRPALLAGLGVIGEGGAVGGRNRTLGRQGAGGGAADDASGADERRHSRLVIVPGHLRYPFRLTQQMTSCEVSSVRRLFNKNWG